MIFSRLCYILWTRYFRKAEGSKDEFAMNETNHLVKASSTTLSTVLAGAWNKDRPQNHAEDEAAETLRKVLQKHHPLLVEEILHWLEEHHQIKREGNDFWILTDPEKPEAEPQLLRIPPLAYLRAMFMIAWSAFRHPWSTTTIDLATGRVVHRS
ncbi:MAG TPA: hypothetical protein VMG10_19490 [Gemmataceae bacterium]|nr:hypothetical protein [Gemmataceae bacterium]